MWGTAALEQFFGFRLNEVTGGLTPTPGSPFAVGKPPDFFATF
jgi:hypothetical protein